MGLLSNRIERSSLKAGDHIYSWRTGYVYSHHGIYIGDDRVIHFTIGQGQGVGSFGSSMPKQQEIPCPNCNVQLSKSNGVVSSCLDCFLDGGVLRRFEYAVSLVRSLAKARGGTCTRAPSDPDDVVVRRAGDLLTYGFGCYNVFKKNCEDFAIYCKTGLLVVERGVVGQAASTIGAPITAVLSISSHVITKNVYGMAVTAVVSHFANQYYADVGNRRDVVKVEVKDLAAGLETGMVQAEE